MTRRPAKIWAGCARNAFAHFGKWGFSQCAARGTGVTISAEPLKISMCDGTVQEPDGINISIREIESSVARTTERG
jgi:hypothetical protein